MDDDKKADDTTKSPPGGTAAERGLPDKNKDAPGDNGSIAERDKGNDGDAGGSGTGEVAEE